jgi:hypothetical protein
LRCLRHGRLPRIFWIDAICINQADEVEKEQQVKKMYEIYKNARQVVVWLGPTTPDSIKALDFAETIYRCFDPAAERLEEERWSEYPDSQKRLRQVESLLAAQYASSWVALHRILSRRWWERAWVLQELVTARKATVCCGDVSLPWVVIGVGILICRDSHHAVLSLGITVETEIGTCQYDWPAEHIERAFDILVRREMKQEDDPEVYNESKSLSSWLSGNRHRACRMPHDKIYSILGLLNKPFQEAIQPNYQITIESLHQSVVKAYVKISSRLDLICHSQHSNIQGYQPSWVPDWSRPEKATIFSELPMNQLSDEPLFANAVSNFPDNGNILAAQGVRIGIIKQTRLEFSVLDDLRKQRWISGTCSTETADSVSTICNETDAPAWWYFEASAERIFLPAIDNLDPCDEQWDNHLDLFFEMLRLEWYPSGSDWYERLSSQPPVQSQKQRLEDFEVFYSHLQGLMKSRTIFETEELQIGIALDFAEQGDIVCKLLGCHVPVILRPGSDNCFSFIGDAYVYKLLESEIVDELEAGRLKVETFQLS